jgi:hypothetical protein
MQLIVCYFTAHCIIHAYVTCRKMNMGFEDYVNFFIVRILFLFIEIALDVSAYDISFWVVSVLQLFVVCVFIIFI